MTRSARATTAAALVALLVGGCEPGSHGAGFTGWPPETSDAGADAPDSRGERDGALHDATGPLPDARDDDGDGATTPQPDGEDAAPCQPDCTGRDCGDDGCGGTCGACSAGRTCEAGGCVVVPGTRFAAQPLHWTVPEGGDEDGGFHMISNNEWRVLDMDGDGLRDFVVSRGPESSHDVFGFGASPYWKVYRNTGSGFETTPTQWAVPTGGDADGGFHMISDNEWAVLDMDGDDLPDLVVSRGPESSQDVFGFGASPYWKVYRNTGSGFEATAAQWPVPTGGDEDGGFHMIFDNEWAVLDMDGDDLPDFVVSRGPESNHDVFGFGAAPYWKVYRNTGSGFETTAAQWPVPTGGDADGGFHMISDNEWAVLDMDGDDLPDFVVSRGPESNHDVFGFGASPYWKVYRNTGSGFETTAAQWPVPTGGDEDGGFHMIFDNEWAVLDMDGDGLRDFVVSRGPESSHDVFGFGASPYWKLYRNTGGGFEATAAQWPVPTGGDEDGGFHMIFNSEWAVLDMDGDDLPDFVVSRGPESNHDVFGFGASPYWKIYLNQP